MHEETGQKTRDGMGVFARTFVELNPLVPTEEEGRLNDEALRENFLERVYCHYRWRTIADTHLQGFVDFHMRHKFMLMARNHQAYRELGRLVAMADRHNLAQIRQQYIQHFMQVMALCPTREQALVQAHYVSQISLSEIARQLGRARESINTRSQRIRAVVEAQGQGHKQNACENGQTPPAEHQQPHPQSQSPSSKQQQEAAEFRKFS